MKQANSILVLPPCLVVAVSVPLFLHLLGLLGEPRTGKDFTLRQTDVLARCRAAPGLHRPTLA